MQDGPISQSANKIALDQVRVDKPSSFTVGATADILAKKADATISYDRRWANGWGATAYIKAWWNDQAVIPRDKFGGVVGGELSKKF